MTNHMTLFRRKYLEYSQTLVRIGKVVQTGGVVGGATVQSDIVISLHSGQNNLEVKLKQEMQGGIFLFVLRISFDRVEGNLQTQKTAHRNLTIRKLM